MPQRSRGVLPLSTPTGRSLPRSWRTGSGVVGASRQLRWRTTGSSTRSSPTLPSCPLRFRMLGPVPPRRLLGLLKRRRRQRFARPPSRPLLALPAASAKTPLGHPRPTSGLRAPSRAPRHLRRCHTHPPRLQRRAWPAQGARGTRTCVRGLASSSQRGAARMAAPAATVTCRIRDGRHS